MITNGGRIRALGLAVALISLLAPASALAGAHRPPRPRLAWTLPRTGSEGQSIAFSWSARHLGRHHRLVIQKPEGTAHTWRSIMRLKSNSGSGRLPGVALGHYRFRIADLVPARRPHRHSHPHFRVIAKEAASIAVFGEVPFSTLFGEGVVGVDTTPSLTFPYAALIQPEVWTNGSSHLFTVEHNHCYQAHVSFIGTFGEWQSEYEATQGQTTLTLVQESRDPVSAVADYESIGSLDAELVPGQSWGVNIAGGNGAYINGYALCDSAQPFS